MQLSAIVVAAGRGTRVGQPTPKAFLILGGQPMLLYSLQTLHHLPHLSDLILVVPSEQIETAKALVDTAPSSAVPTRIVAGGRERQDSVAAGLAVVDASADFVLIHDAARPFVTLAAMQSCVDSAAAHGAAIVAIPAQDTVKWVVGDAIIDHTVDRTRLWLAQTPQVFRADWLRDAYAHAQRDRLVATDDAALVERGGRPVRVVQGDPTNRKITTPEDLRWAEWLLETQEGTRRASE